MATQSIDLLHTDVMKFNNNTVKKLRLNGSTIWGAPIEHSFTGSGNTLNISSTSWTTGVLTVSLSNTPLRTDRLSELALQLPVTGSPIVFQFRSIGETQTIAYYAVQLTALSVEGNTARITVRYRKTGSSYPTGYLQFNAIKFVYPDV